MIVAWNMSERKAFQELLLKKSPESVVAAATFLLTVFVNLIAGAGCGIALRMYRLREAVRRRGAVRAPAGAAAQPAAPLKLGGRG